tara:strand:+ start:709 stop:951 length:243 start_codon:yes stop_codon:yes gene_type:complete
MPYDVVNDTILTARLSHRIGVRKSIRLAKKQAIIDELVAVLTEVTDGIDHDTDCSGDLGPAPCKCIVFRVGYALEKARTP